MLIELKFLIRIFAPAAGLQAFNANFGIFLPENLAL